MKTICSHPGCNRLVDLPDRRCNKHAAQYEEEKKARKLEYDRLRGNSSQRGYDARWQRFRKLYLIKNPVCRICGRLANEIDHITPLIIEPDRKYDESNLQPLCHICHSQKTANIDAQRIAAFKKRRHTHPQGE